MYSLRDNATDDLVVNDKAFAALGRAHVHFDVAVLTATA
jgi:hypothetical protein